MADHDADRLAARDLLAAYAFDAVDDLERRAVERLLAVDPEARRELDEYREVVAAFTADTAPPPALREEVLRRVTAPAPLASAAPARRAARPLRRRFAALGVAAAVVAAVAVPTTIAIQSQSTQRTMQAEADAIAQMLADPNARILNAEMAGGGEVTALVSGGRVMLSASGMSDPGRGKDYQLWTISGDTMTSAGLIHPKDGSASVLLDAAPGTTLAVTVEPAGGSDQPTTDPLVAVAT